MKPHRLQYTPQEHTMPKPKLKTIMIFIAGYVLGARAGQRRYKQLKGIVTILWGLKGFVNILRRKTRRPKK